MTAALQIENFPIPNFSHGRSGSPRVITHHVMMGTEAGTRESFRNPKFGASSNYSVTRDGRVTCFVPPEHTAWANGNMRAPELWIPEVKRCWEQRINPNSITISIEWEGMHTLAADAWLWEEYIDPRTNARVSFQTLKRNGVRAWWEPTAAQYQAGLALTAKLCKDWAIPLDRSHILRHSDWDTRAKWFCPGARFPMSTLIKDLGGHL